MPSPLNLLVTFALLSGATSAGQQGLNVDRANLLTRADTGQLRDSVAMRLGVHLDSMEFVLTRERALAPIRPNVGVRDADGVRLAELKSAIGGTSAALLAGLGDARFSGMRAYVRAKLPNPDDLPSYSCGGENCVAPNKADSVWMEADQLVETLRQQVDRVRVDVVMRSVPAGATFTLRAHEEGDARSGVADGVLKNVYRGLYDYTVALDGYKMFTSSMDLVDDPQSMIVCTLVPRTQAQGSTVCRLQMPPAKP